jgi:hypothetical protein
MRLTQVRAAWLWLVVALALHVIDEASTGFLDVYNPTVRALRERFGWSPMPEFRFDAWVAGLAVLVLGLALLTPLVDQGLRSVRAATIVFAGLMVLNGVAHLTGTIAGRTIATVRFERPMPGSWSSPLLIGAAVLFIVRARDRRAVDRGIRPRSLT